MGKTIAVLTSGGDAPGMNVAILAIAKIAAARGVRVMGRRPPIARGSLRRAPPLFSSEP